jgi:enamine deaminase RidA (YjgF/YER057c/UK114 family)
MSAQQAFASLGLSLPPAPKPAGAYKPFLVDGRHVYVSGHLPVRPDGTLITGRVGRDLDAAGGQAAARQAALTILATLTAGLGSLDGIKRVIKVLGMVNATDDFTEHPFVINGCSELFGEIWGPDHGIGVRSSIGVGSLPGNVAVEIEALFERA